MNKLLLCATVVFLQTTAMAQDKKTATLDIAQADEDFAVQGEYLGTVNDGAVPMGLQVIARGDGRFQAVGYPGGFPGEGWDGNDDTRVTASGRRQDGRLILDADDGAGRAEIRDGLATITDAGGAVIGALKKVTRKSDTLGSPPPDGAIVLFDGTTTEHFQNGRMTEDGLLMQGTTTQQKFGSYQLHLEFLLSYMPHARGQGRANSGCYHQGRYEVQILDSFGLSGEDNECGGIYSIARPAANMCYPPLAWQTYDVDFQEAKFDDNGTKTADAEITVLHNGIKIHDGQKLSHATTASPLQEGREDGPIYLQDHGNPIRFRNIWVQPYE